MNFKTVIVKSNSTIMHSISAMVNSDSIILKTNDITILLDGSVIVQL